jgi:hypothetical protein
VTKTFGVGIFCRECSAQPHPDPGSEFRESFDLLCIAGEWFCELHRPPKQKRASRVAAATPAEAVDQFERILASEFTKLEKEVANGDHEDIADALRAYAEEFGRALADLKKALAEQTPARVENAPQTKRARPKPITARERDQEGQGDLIADQKTEG